MANEVIFDYNEEFTAGNQNARAYIVLASIDVGPFHCHKVYFNVRYADKSWRNCDFRDIDPQMEDEQEWQRLTDSQAIVKAVRHFDDLVSKLRYDIDEYEECDTPGMARYEAHT